MDPRRLIEGTTRGDVLVPLAVFGLAVAELLGMNVVGEPISLGADAVCCLLLVWRRRAPVPIALAVVATQLSLTFLDVSDEPAVPILIFGLGLFALGRYRGLRRGGPWMAVALLGALLTLSTSEDFRDASNVAFVTVILVTPWAFGLAVGRMDEARTKFATTTERLELERERAGAEAIAAERARIARELHDVIAHSVSVMVVQAGAAQDLVQSDPHRAGQLLTSVQDSGRRALSETSHLLGLLRADDTGVLAPQAGLADLESLIAEFREAGLDVTLERDPVPGGRMDDELPVGIDVSAYRIVEESLTNALKHAPDAVTHVHVSHGPNELQLQIVNQPGTPRADAPGGGHGLAGLRERAHVFGGELTAGPTPAGGFAVDVRLPARNGL